MIYIIGDSHVSVFSGTDKTHDGLRHIQPEFGTCYTLLKGQLRPVINRFEQKIPYFYPIKVGSYTAYNSFSKLERIEQAISEYKISSNDFIFLCFGEIDIRHHIGFQAEKQNIDIIKSIELCVNSYFKTIIYLRNKYPNIGVYAPPASSVGWDNSGYKDVTYRNFLTLEFNKYLKFKCDENRIPFKDISKIMILPDGSTDQKFIMDDIHLSQNIMPFLIQEFSDII
jgi:hypothetical protein